MDEATEAESIRAEAEIHDVHYWTRTVSSKIVENEKVTSEVVAKFEDVLTKIEEITKNNSEIKRGMEKIANLIEEQDALNAQHVVEDSAKTSTQHEVEDPAETYTQDTVESSAASSEDFTASDESFEVNEKTLSSTAKNLINGLQDGPLDPNTFLKFLMEKTFGKPKPSVLPILRGYISSQMLDRFGTDQEVISNICGQLKSLRDQMKQAHLEYKEERRRKDVNLERRIERLLENVAKELAAEGSCGMRQPSIAGYLRAGTKRKFTN